MSATRSASTGMPYLNPKLTTVAFSDGRLLGAEGAARRWSVSWCTLRPVVSMTRSASRAQVVERDRARGAGRRAAGRPPGAGAAGGRPPAGGPAPRRWPRGTAASCGVRREPLRDAPPGGRRRTTRSGRRPRRRPAAAGRGSRRRAGPRRPTSCGGRLSTTKKPRSSSSLAAVLRPAPVMPVTTTTSPRSSRLGGTPRLLGCRQDSSISPVAVFTLTAVRPCVARPARRRSPRRSGCRCPAPRRSPPLSQPAASSASRTA